ncbi:DUF58 domain-containing protein [Deinococcus aquiradiocola]|uniref:DUF58 domain-containing protein n=1 Tax=Deinococcus aquiradiocola TaxID=393059 RepID=A0A917PD08_9DEIO|nr:DUF58 domain-containing protein [Deinococcus aquiradiocola]GGJ71442.1 hypothetical protein GCM10008939_14800 [Deinococcus aquiradiocola]
MSSPTASGAPATRPAEEAGRPPPVYVLPTRFGGGFVLVALLTLIGCINYLLSLGYALTFLLLSVWVVCAVHASRALNGVTLDAALPDRTFAGRPGQLHVTLDAPPAGGVVGVRAGPDLQWLDGPGRATLTLPALPRGPQHLPTVRCEAHDPLGLWRSSTYPARDRGGQPLLREVLVLPAPEVDAPPPPAAPVQGSGVSERRSAGEEEVHGLREYRPGDAPRRIAWKQAARTGTLLTRTYDAPATAALALGWDSTREAGDTEARLSRLCAWVLHAERLGAPFTLDLPGTRLALDHGETQVRQALTLLARHGRTLPPAPRSRWPWERP